MVWLARLREFGTEEGSLLAAPPCPALDAPLFCRLLAKALPGPTPLSSQES